MRKILILAILTLAGCASDIDAPPASPSGNSADIRRYMNLTVKPEWRYEVMPDSLKYITLRLKHPTTAVFDSDPIISAYYDKDKTSSWLQLSGHAHSFATDGAVSHQTYIINWEQDGNAATNKNTQWDFKSLDVVNDDPNDRTY
jgi:hypothetical protein